MTDNFFSKFADLFNSPQHSDLSVVAGNQTLFIHHAILSLRTTWFDRSKNTNKDGAYVFPSHSAHAVWRVLKYCYAGDYPSESNNVALGEEDDLGVLKHLRVFALADLLGITKLKTLSVEKLQQKLAVDWVAEDFHAVVRELHVRGGDHAAAREVLLDAAEKHRDELLGNQDFLQVLGDFGEFAALLLVKVCAQAQEHQRNTRPKCEACEVCENKTVAHWCMTCKKYIFE